MTQGGATGNERFDLELLRAATRYQQWVLSALQPHVTGTVLEVGAGIGNFTRWIARSASRLVALEPEADMAREIEGLGLRNVQVVTTPLEELAGSDWRFDSVVLINVLEHLRDDQQALLIAHRLLRPGGCAGILVPAHPTLYGSLDRTYRHLRRYTRAGVERKLKLARFQTRFVRYFNPVGAVGWLLVGRVAHRTHLNRGSIDLAERIAVPLGRVMERFGAPPFGQSVIAAAARPDVWGANRLEHLS